MALEQNIQNLVGIESLGIDTISYLGSFFASLIIGALIGIVFKLNRPNLYSGFLKAHHFLFLAGTVTLIVAVIRSSIALSLGLVGAVSVIRFRTAIKDPEELLYLFLAIAASVGFGAGYISITSLSVLLLLSISLGVSFVGKKTSTGFHQKQILHLQIEQDSNLQWTQVESFLKQYARFTILRFEIDENHRNYAVLLSKNIDSKTLQKFETHLSEFDNRFELSLSVNISPL